MNALATDSSKAAARPASSSSTIDAITRRCVAQRRIATPLGPLLLARTEQGLAGAWFDKQRHHPAPIDAPAAPADPLLDRARRAFDAYFAGSDAAFDVPLDLIGSGFQCAVWAELLKIDRGMTTTYGAIAKALGQPNASRAVGAAVGRNPVSVFVPCHRVVGGDGSLTGYAGGLERKTALLRLESAQAELAAR